MNDEMRKATEALREKMAKVENRAPRLSWNNQEAFESVAAKSSTRLVIKR